LHNKEILVKPSSAALLQTLFTRYSIAALPSTLRPDFARKARGKHDKIQGSIGPGNSEAKCVCPAGRAEPAPEGGTRALWAAAPGTAPQTTAGTIPPLRCSAFRLATKAPLCGGGG